MSTPTRSPNVAVISAALLLLIGTLWGLFFALIKKGITGGVTPMSYLFWFTLMAGTILFCLCRVRRTRPRFTKLHLRFYASAAALRFVFANIVLYTVQGKIPVGIMAVIMTLVPILTYATALVFRVEKFLRLRFCGIVVAFIGVAMIVAPKDALPDPALIPWVLLGLLTPLLHGAGYVFLSEKNRPADSDSLSVACGTLWLASALSLPIAVAFGQFQFLAPPFSDGELAMMTHALLAGFNFYAIFELIRIAGPTYMSQANFLSVVFGVLFGIVLFGESHSWWVWGAMGMTVIGVALVSARRE
jgi:drug/metabolite transporter (DMT)-like permease